LAKQHMSKSFRDALLYLLAIAKGETETHFARRLYKSMKGLGTDATALNFNIVKIHEGHMMEKTKAAFFQMYGTTLTSWIKDDARGLWQRLLLELCGVDNVENYGARKVTFEVIAKGDEVKRELLKSDDVFVLDAGFEVFAWCGKQASAFERRHALQYAQLYVSHAKLPPTTPISRILDGGSNTVFEACFQQT